MHQSILSIIRTVHYLLRARPTILVVSLWRSCFVGLIVKIFHPRLPIILFVHSPRSEHFVDSFFTFACSLVCSELWFDSKQTSRSRFVNASQIRKTISYLPSRITPQPFRHVGPNFIFWGRLHTQKNLSRSLSIFSDILHCHPDATFRIIGPDCGELSLLRQLVLDLHLERAVSFLGSLDFAAIYSEAESASFYLQTSSYEGMAVSVIEAMQMGLVPVVAPVGEISEYAQHKVNSIVLNCGINEVDDILMAIDNDIFYQEMRSNAVSCWRTQATYPDSFLNACNAALAALGQRDL